MFSLPSRGPRRSPLRIGLVGVGWAARNLHVPAIRAGRCGELVAVCDPRPGARAMLSVPGFADLDALLREGRCDAIVVAAPPDRHADIAIRALEAGTHVLLEKPLAVDLADGERVAATAAAAGRVLAIGFNLRSHPAIVRLREAIGSGRWGPVQSIHVTWRTTAGRTARDWLGTRARGGGVLFDLGSHVVDLWRFLGGDIAGLGARLEPGLIEDAAAQLSGTLRGGIAVSADLSLLGPDVCVLVVRCRDRTITIRPYRSGLAASYVRQWRAFAAAIGGCGNVAADASDGLAALRDIAALTASLPVAAGSRAPPLAFPITLLVATSRDFEAIRTTVAHFARQTIAAQAELVLVGPSEAALAGARAHTAAFGALVCIGAGPAASVAQAIALGVQRARGRVVAFAEDHCFPDPEWAEALVRAHEADCSVVGPVLRNANPATRVSEADFAMGYGPWMEPLAACNRAFLPGHNSSYKRDELLALGERLPELLESETVLHMQWAAEGRLLRVEPGARMRHVNFSRWRSFVAATFLAGRAFGGSRARPWAWRRRLVYAGASPLIPAVRFVRIAREFTRPGRSLRRFLRLLPALAVGLAIDGAGQCLGYLRGPGDAMRRLARYEYNRREHVRADERALWTSP